MLISALYVNSCCNEKRAYRFEERLLAIFSSFVRPKCTQNLNIHMHKVDLDDFINSLVFFNLRLYIIICSYMYIIHTI